MTPSPSIIEFIKGHEGLYLNAYLDPVNVWTVGYGHTRTAKRGQTITAAEAERLLIQDLQTAQDAVKALVKVPLTQNQYDALVSFVFNLGAGNLAKSTLLRKLNAGDYKGAANEFQRWNKAGGRVLPGLTRRREGEREIFLSDGKGGIFALIILALLFGAVGILKFS